MKSGEHKMHMLSARYQDDNCIQASNSRLLQSADHSVEILNKPIYQSSCKDEGVVRVQLSPKGKNVVTLQKG